MKQDDGQARPRRKHAPPAAFRPLGGGPHTQLVLYMGTTEICGDFLNLEKNFQKS